MDVREKLADIIQNSVGGCARHWAEIIADGLIANGVTVQDNTEISDELLEQLRNTPITILQEEPTIEVVQEWISVNDRLPECDQVVLCYKADRGVRVGKHIGATYADGILAFKDCSRDYAFGATHWMPLPQPPKGE